MLKYFHNICILPVMALFVVGQNMKFVLYNQSQPVKLLGMLRAGGNQVDAGGFD